MRVALHLHQVGNTSEVAPYSQLSFERISRAAHSLVEQQYRLFNEELMPVLKKQGLQLITHDERNAAQHKWVKQYFDREVRPLLTPVSLDPAHPFPMVANKSLNFIVRLTGKDAFGRENDIAIVKVPRSLPRVIRLPASVSGKAICMVSLSSVIRSHLVDLFPTGLSDSFLNSVSPATLNCWSMKKTPKTCVPLCGAGLSTDSSVCLCAWRFLQSALNICRIFYCSNSSCRKPPFTAWPVR